MKVDFKILDDGIHTIVVTPGKGIAKYGNPPILDFSTIEISPQNDEEKEICIKHSVEIHSLLENFLYECSTDHLIVAIQHKLNNFIQRKKDEG